MNYRNDRYGNQLSILGFGCMRFTQKGTSIDIDKAEKEIMEAYRAGVNYFDTAYVYPGSEAAVGEILERNQIRDKVNIATKLPHYLIKSKEGIEKLFKEELRRLRTDHIDYYLMHMMNDIDTWEKLKKLGIEQWILEKKQSGQIRQIGFSYHGNSDMFCKVIDAFDWDFCQIQYNYMDVNSQAGVTGLKYANSKGLPVVIMEPLRGGKLVNLLPKEALDIFVEYPIQHNPASWAFRWLWNQPEVTVVLSGMNSVEMVQDNIETASTSFVGDLKEAEEAMLKKVADAINAKMKVGCTGCRYCMPCPKGVDIPGTFSCYNHYYTEGKGHGQREYMMTTALRRNQTGADNCIECGKCELHCPQHIKVREELKNARRKLENPVYKVVKWAVKAFKIY